MSVAMPEVIQPQPGRQEQFLRCPARVAIYGGAAGGGKTYACLLEPLYHIGNPKFEAVIFRRYYKSIILPGGLYARSQEIYPQVGAHYNKSDLIWTFPSEAKARFSYLQYDTDVEKYKSSEIALILFDELTEFSKYMFFYMFSRNRSVSGVKPYIRGYTNPDADSWVKVLLAPWVDDTWPAEDRAESGEIRYFVHKDDVITWVDADHRDSNGKPDAISITFVRADLYDNRVLMEKNPEYESGLDALPELEKRRLKYGDWNIRPGGKMFKRDWFPVLDAIPGDIEYMVRFWDKAATEKREAVRGKQKGNDPDYTAGILMARRRAGSYPRYLILDAIWEQKGPGGVETLIKQTAAQDGYEVAVRWEEEGGSAGKDDSFNFVTKVLEGYDARGIRSTGSKALRAATLSAQAQVGNVGLVRGVWNSGFLNFMVAFPSELVHDDVPDAASGSFNALFLHEGNIPVVVTGQRERDLPALHLPEKEQANAEALIARQAQMARILQSVRRQADTWGSEKTMSDTGGWV